MSSSCDNIFWPFAAVAESRSGATAPKSRWQRLLDRVWPMCPTGRTHRQHGGMVRNAYGGEYCWHHECISASLLRVYNHEKSKADQESHDAVQAAADRLLVGLAKVFREIVREELKLHRNGGFK